MADKRLAGMMSGKSMPFDGKRMIYGGFESREGVSRFSRRRQPACWPATPLSCAEVGKTRKLFDNTRGEVTFIG
jgi:hypothetical protein